MARRPRIYFPGALYHVIARGNQKQGIFLEEIDFKTYLSYLSEYKSKYSFYLYAYALMKNHSPPEVREGIFFVEDNAAPSVSVHPLFQ